MTAKFLLDSYNVDILAPLWWHDERTVFVMSWLPKPEDIAAFVAEHVQHATGIPVDVRVTGSVKELVPLEASG